MSKFFLFTLSIFSFFSFTMNAMNQPMLPNPYQVVGVGLDATDQDINQAYRKLSRLYHPDRCAYQQATAISQEINAAKNQLMQKCHIDDCKSKWHLIVKLSCNHMVCKKHLLEIRDLNTGKIKYFCPLSDCTQIEITDENATNIENQLNQQALTVRFYEQMPLERRINDGKNWWCVSCGNFIGTHGITLPTCGHDVCPTCIENGVKHCSSTTWCLGKKIPLSEEQLYNLKQELPGKNELIVQQKQKIKKITITTTVSLAAISGIGYYLYTQWKHYSKKKKQAKKREKEEQEKQDQKLMETLYRHYSMQNA